jgi:hypothetical protein
VGLPTTAWRFGGGGFTLPYTEAIADTRQVLEETLELVELRFPSMDTAQIHRQLGYTRAEQSIRFV